MQRFENVSDQETTYPPCGALPITRALLLDDAIVPLAFTCAQWRTEPAIVLWSSLTGVTEAFESFFVVTAPLRSCRVPTVPGPSPPAAAYPVPPSATNNAV